MDWTGWLDTAHQYAKKMSGCNKVSVGSAIVKNGKLVSIGANRAIPDLCKVKGCHRIEKYGNNDKTHREPGDCRAIHSEIDAIASASVDLTGACIYVTRYPCEQCAKAIVTAGIHTVIYGRQQKISNQTEDIFEDADIQVVWLKGWDADDVTN